MTFTKYVAKVRGVIWDGGKAHTSYEFIEHPTRADVMRVAGDFQQVLSISLKCVETKISSMRVREETNNG